MVLVVDCIEIVLHLFDVWTYILDNFNVFYHFRFEQDDGQKHDEQGELLNAGSENESLVVKGSYSWVGPDDVMYLVRYTADENGFQPTIEQGPGGAVPPGVVASLLGWALPIRTKLVEFNKYIACLSCVFCYNFLIILAIDSYTLSYKILYRQLIFKLRSRGAQRPKFTINKMNMFYTKV